MADVHNLKFSVAFIAALFITSTQTTFAHDYQFQWAEQSQHTQLARAKCEPGKPVRGNFVVERGVDGDTVYVRNSRSSYSVRMIGMDTPETHYMGESQGEWGELAAERLRELLPPGKKVRLEFGADACDQYGRILAHVFVGKTHVNKELVKEGLAVNYCVYPSMSHCKELGALTERAMEKRIGMFSDPEMELPYDFRRRISGKHQRSFVGSIRTKEVYRPGRQDDVPVGERVFFYQESLVKAPYHIVD